MARIRFIKNKDEFEKTEWKPKSIRFRKIAVFWKVKTKEYRKKYFIFFGLSIAELLVILSLIGINYVK